jgi:FkbM family methyltransferase
MVRGADRLVIGRLSLAETSFTYRRRRFTLVAPDGDHLLRAIDESGCFYEIDLLEQLWRRLPPIRAAVDVGANIGNHTIFLAGVLGADVIAVEPSPVAAEYLRRNIAANGLTNVRVVEAAAGAEPGTVTLSEPPQLGHAKVSPGGSIPMTTVDDIAAELPRVDFVKIDVEGFESEVLAGCRSTIDRHQPAFAIENLPELAGYRRQGPFGATPAYLHAVRWRRRAPGDPGYRVWRATTRGKLARRR